MIELCGISLYADDTAIFYFSDDIDDIRLSLQHDLQSVSVWMRENHLSLNVKKTKLMQVGSRRNLSSVPSIGLSLNGERIDSVTEFKYLGIILDPNLLFDKHIDYIIDKSTTKLGLLYKTRWLFNMETAKMLYGSLVTPYFDLGNTVYMVAPQYQLNRLQVVQNAAARLILLAEPRTPVYELHAKLEWDTLAMRATKSLVKILYGCLHEQLPTGLFDKLKPVDYGGRRTRATESGVLVVPRAKTNYGKCSFAHRGPLQWNNTRTCIKAAVNKVQLKTLLKNNWYGT